MPFHPLKDLLPRSIRAAGIAPQVEAAQAIAACQRVLRQLLPESICREVQLLHLRDGVLTVRTTSPVVAQELRLRETLWLGRLRGASPLPVQRVRYQLDTGEGRWDLGDLSAP